MDLNDFRSSKAELESLTVRFHLNLTAMGMSGRLSGLFIFYRVDGHCHLFTRSFTPGGILRQTGAACLVGSWR
ncbi:hypothetical protein O9929_18475 [Vibrio lentus]|nr:hypothetical protein [Vibrio lentus]